LLEKPHEHARGNPTDRTHEDLEHRGRISAHQVNRLMDPRRLETQLSEPDLVRLLALNGDEDVVDLGSGAGFYTDRVAALTTGTVYALDLQPEMHDFYRSRGVPPNVRLILGDVRHLDLPPASLDVALSVSTWHESGGIVDLSGLARALHLGGRLIVVDWRRDTDSPEAGPPPDVLFRKEEVAASLSPHFRPTLVENLGASMFAVVAIKAELPVE
jgi:SAM-dependent methyltransferase